MFLPRLLQLWSATSAKFGWEGVDPTKEMSVDLYVHQRLTHDTFEILRAKSEANGIVKWVPNSSETVKWHVDYVDSYLYNPLFWASGIPDHGLRRIKAAASTHDQLVTVHFDDLTSTVQIEQMWHRYLSGCIAGLLWAADRNDVEAAHNIVGVTLHAIQDFYSHSNWVDAADRRNQPWYAIKAEQRRNLYLYTGSYEVDQHHSQKPHGKVAMECAVINAVNVADVLSIACSAMSPLNKMPPCQIYDKCKGAEPVSVEVLGVQLPEGLAYVNPPGIALDSSWQARIAHQIRELPDRAEVTPQALFDSAKKLAVDTSVWWLERLEDFMALTPETKEFWQRVKTIETAWEGRTDQYEDFSRFPHTFVSAGHYPPTADDGMWDWYLRFQIKTSDEGDAGTDAGVFVRCGDQEFPLNYMPTSSAILEYNDFEQGDNTTYTVGPLKELPREVTFRVETKDVGDVFEVIWDGFVGAVESLIETIGDIFMSIIGGHADYVGSTQVIWNPADLENIGFAPADFERTIDGGDEGKFIVKGNIRRTAEAIGPDVPYEWMEYEVHLKEVYCEEESDWDRGSWSDESFLLSMLVNLADHDNDTRVQPWRSDVADDVDDGETFGLNHTFARIRVPRHYGGIALPMSMMEHDDESIDARNELLDEFAGKGKVETQSWTDQFVETIGAALWSGWKPESVEIQAFNRAPARAASGTVLRATPGRWVTGDESLTLALDANPAWRRWSLPKEVIRSQPIADALVDRSSKLIGTDPNESVACAQEAVGIYRSLLEAEPKREDYQRRLVWALHVLSSRMYTAGRRSETAGLGDEGVRVSQRIADPDASARADVASNLGHISGYLLPGDEAVRSAQETARLARLNAAESPGGAAHEGRLVWALHVLSSRLYGAGQRSSTDGLGDEAVRASRRVVQASSDARTSLVADLGHISGYLDAGREAVRVAEETARLARVNAAESPGDAAHEVRLVWALHVLSSRLYGAGYRSSTDGLGDEAVQASQRVRDTASPEARMNLSGDLGHISGYLDAGDEAVRVAQETAALARLNVNGSAGNSAYEVRMVWALHVLTSRLYSAGRQSESAGMGDEAVQAAQRAQGSGAKVRFDIAGDLGHLAGYLVPGDEAVRATDHTVAMSRRLYADEPGNPAYKERLIWALRGHSARLRAVGRTADAEAVEKEILTLTQGQT